MKLDGRAALAAVRNASLARAWRADRKRIVVMGHSLGTLPAIDVCASNPDLMGCVLLAPRDPGRDLAMAEQMSATERDQFAAEYFEGLDERTNGATARDLVDILAGNEARLRALRVAPMLTSGPTLIIAATQDKYNQGGSIPAMAEAGAAAAMRIDLDSNVNFDNHRAGLQALVLKWIAALPGSPAIP